MSYDDSASFLKFLDILRKIDAQPDKAGIFQIVFDFCKEFGFTHLTMGQAVYPSLNHITYPDLGISNYPEKFQKEYIEGHYILHDPVIKKAVESTESFIWSKLPLKDYKAKEIMAHCAAHGMTDGLCVPIHADTRFPGIVSFAGRDFTVTDHDIKALELISFHAYMRIMDLHMRTRVKSREPITPRQTDVLAQTANGKTAVEIAQILSISPDTVRDHMRSIRRILGASNAAHAVMIAIRDGYIRV